MSEEIDKEMDKESFYKYLADLEKLSKTQLIMVKSVIEGLLKGNTELNIPYTYVLPKYDNIPNCCKNCPNFKEGAICHCTLPYLEQFRDPIPNPYISSPPPLRTVTTDGTGVYTEPNITITSGVTDNYFTNKRKR